MADNGENPPLEIACERELLLIVLLLSLLSLAAIVNVYAAANETRERARVVRKGNASIEDPAVHAVVAAEAVFHLEWFTAAKMIEVARNAALEILSMHALCPAVPRLLLE